MEQPHLIRPVPHSDADAALHRLARGNHRLIIRLLLRQKRVRHREGHPDVQLSDSDLHAEAGEGLQVRLDGGGQRADDEVALDADAVDGHAVLLQLFDEVEHGRGLVAEAFDVVVVDVKFRSGISGARGPQCERNVARPDGGVEDGLAEGSIIVEGFFKSIRLYLREKGKGIPLTTSQLSSLNVSTCGTIAEYQ
jgi:hypothetical protein